MLTSLQLQAELASERKQVARSLKYCISVEQNVPTGHYKQILSS